MMIRGRIIVKQLVWPGVLSSLTRPPCISHALDQRQNQASAGSLV
jgi:hypothetical protein